MKKNLFLSSLSIQTGSSKPTMSIQDRLAKARAAKVAKRLNPSAVVVNRVRLLAVDLQRPPSKALRGPHKETVHVGERGGKFYINKHGNRTYLSSNL